MESSGWPYKLPLLFGGLAGILYGVACRLFVQLSLQIGTRADMAMSVGFLFFVPFAIGYLTIASAWKIAPRSTTEWIFAPWVAIAVGAALVWILRDSFALFFCCPSDS
jgi:hypothetical protein